MFFNWFRKKKNAKGLLGVDIQADQLAIAHILFATKKEHKPTLKQCTYKELSSADEKESSETLLKMVPSFPAMQFPCNTVIDKNHYELLLIPPPNVESDELRQSVKWLIKDQLGYHIDDAIIDIFEIPGQQSARTKLIYVVAAQRREIELRAKQLKNSGLDIAFIDIYELAQRNIAKLFEQDKDGIVMLRLKEQSGLLTITCNGVLYLTRKIDFGTQKMKAVLPVSSTDFNSTADNSDEEIELFLDDKRVDDGENHPVSTLTDQGKLILDDVILEIQRSLDYYVSHFNQRQVKKIVFSPMDQEIPGAIEYVNEMLGIEAEFLDFNQYLNVSKPLSREIQSHCFEAIGLALRQNDTRQ
ncbi:MAG: pilus assembly protein PilM [Thiotrichaceae bacterium]|nr:pilus assembly protein PilM [Thiotrichaceae bacterium]